MAIQLNERDHLIFKYVEEHQVLLEKHIAWFISADQKPVLIRDRLRKLFYLDYLLCQRHKNTLPWWTTPTKPLVYTLAPLTRSLIAAKDNDLDLSDADVQRHLLEVANLRMLFLIDGSEDLISDFEWTTCSAHRGGVQYVDAKVTFVRNGVTHRVGIINHPDISAPSASASSARQGAAAADGSSPPSPRCTSTVQGGDLMSGLEAALADEEIDMVWIVSRDEDHQEKLQQSIMAAVGTDSSINQRLAFGTHQELYKAGMVKTRWQTLDQRNASIFVESIQEYEAKTCHRSRAQAVSA